MRKGSKRPAFVVALCLTSAALAGCQTAENKPVVTAQAQQTVSPDIHRILTAGGLSPAAPGALQTAKMPAQVQQAVAALSGQPADPAAAALLAAQSGQASVPTAASAPLALVAADAVKPSSILPPMIAETPSIKRLNAKAPAGRPAKETSVASVPAKAVPFEQAARSVVAVQGVAGEPQVSAMRSYLPAAPMFSPEPVIISGPGARPVRMIQAQPKIEQPPAPAPVVEVKAAPAPEPEVRIRRF